LCSGSLLFVAYVYVGYPTLLAIWALPAEAWASAANRPNCQAYPSSWRPATKGGV
jgi:hypothetical protein